MSQEPLPHLKNEPFYWPNPSTSEQSQAILLLHGLGGGSYELRPIAERLRQLPGISVKGVNYPGHDRAASRMPASTWPEWYTHIEAEYEALRQNHPRVSVIGFSTGCPLALKLAHQADIDRLVLLSPFLEIKRHFPLPLEPFVPTVSRWLEHVPRFGLPIADPHMRKQAEAAAFIETFNLRSVHSALELIREVKPLLGRIENPALIIQSHRDAVVDPRGAKYLMQHLGSSQKRIHWLNRSNHIISLDVEREEVFSHILDFLQE